MPPPPYDACQTCVRFCDVLLSLIVCCRICANRYPFNPMPPPFHPPPHGFMPPPPFPQPHPPHMPHHGQPVGPDFRPVAPLVSASLVRPAGTECTVAVCECVCARVPAD